MLVSSVSERYATVTKQAYGSRVDVPLRALLLLGLAAVAPAPAPHAAPACYDAAIVSLRNGATLHRYHASDGGLIRANSASASSPLLPGEDAVTDGRGGWYVAGTGLAHLLGNGRLDRSWHSQLHRHLALWTLARAGDRLIVSDGQRVFGVDLNGRLLWRSGSIGGGSMARIYTLAATSSRVYVGGAFKRFAGSTRGQLVSLDAATGRLLAWRAPGLKPYSPATSRSVTTLGLGTERLYFAGSFSGVGRAVRQSGVAAVRLRDGGLTGFAPRAPVLGTLALAAVHGNVLVGGGDSGGVFDSKTGRRRLDSSVVGSAVAIAVRGSTAYVGGNLRSGVGPHNLMAVNVRTGVDRLWFPNVARYVGVAKIALSGDKAFVGGQFCSSIG